MPQPPARLSARPRVPWRRGFSALRTSRVRLALLACLLLTGLRALLQLASPAAPGDALALRQPEYAYATFFGSEDFLPAVQVLLHTLAATRPAHPLVLCVVEGAVSRAALAAVLHRAPMRVEVQLWTPLQPPPGSTHAPRWALNWNKLRLWQLPGYSKVLYLDADMLVLRNMDSAFEARVDRFLGTPDWGKWTRPGSAKMNGGVFLLQPSEETFRRLVAFSRRTGRYRSREAEQGLLNAYFGRGGRRLPHSYNVQKTMSVHHPALFNLATTHGLHFVGEKPWVARAGREEPDPAERARLEANDLRDSADYSELHSLWWAVYLRLRAPELGQRLTLHDVGGGEGGGLSAAQWPVPLHARPRSAPPLPLLQAACAAGHGQRTPYLGFVRRDAPPPWTQLRLPAVAQPWVVSWGAEWVGDLAASAAARHPELRAPLQRLSTRHLGRRRFIRLDRLILSRAQLGSAARHVAAHRSRLGGPPLRPRDEEALSELLFNVWAAESAGVNASRVVWL